MSSVRGGALLRAAHLTNDEESGASVVEFALLAPLVFMLVFGMLTGGLAWNSKQNLTHAAREAARYGATLPPSIPGWADLVSERAKASSFGELGDAVSNSEKYICVAYVGGSTTYVKQIGTPAEPASGPGCYSDGRTEARVQVRVERKADLEFVLGRVNDMSLRSDATGRHEVSD